MSDPFDSQWYTVNHELPAYCYIKLKPGTVERTVEYSNTGEFPEVLLDLDADGTILGIELLVPGKVTYDMRKEES